MRGHRKRHRYLRMSNKDFLTDNDLDGLVKAIHDAEEQSSGEIRIHIDRHTSEGFAKVAMKLFFELGMQKTKKRNGVLFYVSFEHRYLTIIGDKGIHEKVHQSFWNQMHDEITTGFKNEEYFQSLKTAVLKTGLELKKYFPLNGKPLNELPNDITFS